MPVTSNRLRVVEVADIPNAMRASLEQSDLLVQGRGPLGEIGRGVFDMIYSGCVVVASLNLTMHRLATNGAAGAFIQLARPKGRGLFGRWVTRAVNTALAAGTAYFVARTGIWVGPAVFPTLGALARREYGVSPIDALVMRARQTALRKAPTNDVIEIRSLVGDQGEAKQLLDAVMLQADHEGASVIACIDERDQTRITELGTRKFLPVDRSNGAVSLLRIPDPALLGRTQAGRAVEAHGEIGLALG